MRIHDLDSVAGLAIAVCAAIADAAPAGVALPVDALIQMLETSHSDCSFSNIVTGADSLSFTVASSAGSDHVVLPVMAMSPNIQFSLASGVPYWRFILSIAKAPSGGVTSLDWKVDQTTLNTQKLTVQLATATEPKILKCGPPAAD